MTAPGEGRNAPRSPASLAALTAAALALVMIFAGLGIWQVERRAWKRDLIARVDARLAAAPEPLPPSGTWGAVSAATDEYRRVLLRGRFLPVAPAFVQALTERGAGFWLLAPFALDGGGTVLVNRGFAPADARDAAARSGLDRTEVAGLLRLPEPGGGFLRANDPARDRWFSRDVAEIAAARGLGPVAPFFVDADATPNPGGWPLGGLTVVRFADSHAVYALTWFALAAMVAGGWIVVVRHERRLRPARA